jgi:hypothetical protein
LPPHLCEVVGMVGNASTLPVPMSRECSVGRSLPFKQMKKLAAVQVNLFSTEAIVQLPNSLYDLTLKLN